MTRPDVPTTLVGGSPLLTPGQAAYEAWASSSGTLRPWSHVQQFEAEVRDWECAAAGVVQRAVQTLEKLRASFVSIGAHPQSFWDTGEDVALIDGLLSHGLLAGVALATAGVAS